MQRFKNLLVVYDIVPGGDEALRKAAQIAKRNDAKLMIVHVVNPLREERTLVAERERMLTRLVAGIQIPAKQKSWVVHYGIPSEVILDIANRIDADMIITPEHEYGLYAQLMARDTSAELVRQAAFPTWIMRPSEQKQFQRIVVALDAGAPDALESPANRRMLEIASSLAEIEGAKLDLVYAWDYEGKERDMILSELPRGKYEELSEQARLRNLGYIIKSAEHFLGDFNRYQAVPLRGHPRKVIVDYIKEQEASLLIIDGQIDGPIKSAFFDNLATHLLKHSGCSVLCTRHAPNRIGAQLSDAA